MAQVQHAEIRIRLSGVLAALCWFGVIVYFYRTGGTSSV